VVRLLTTLAIVNGLAGLVAPATAAAWSDWFVALAGYGTISSLALWLISASTRTSRHQPRHHRRQYSLASLMSVVTLASVLLGMTRWVSISWPQLASFAAVGWWMAILALVTLQGVTAERPGWFAMPIAVALLAGVLLCRMTGLYDTCYFTLLCLAQIATITVGMLAVQPSLVPAGATKQAA
jgi:hypothetical protein